MGCKEQQADAPIRDTTGPVIAETESVTYCFRNEFPYKEDLSKKDIQELIFSVKNGTVEGVYNWLPAEKDHRKGTFTGSLNNNLIEAEYSFMQEGQKRTSPIQIVLVSDAANISGGKPELGLTAAIKKVTCSE